MSWAPGTIVVCVDASEYNGTPPPGKTWASWDNMPLLTDCYYVVRAYKAGHFDYIQEDGVWLENIQRITECGSDQPFGAYRFRLAESTHSEAGSVRQKESVNK